MTRLAQRCAIGSRNSKNTTLLIPAKSAARLWVLISPNSESAVKIACDLNRVNIDELTGASPALLTIGLYKNGDDLMPAAELKSTSALRSSSRLRLLKSEMSFDAVWYLLSQSFSSAFFTIS